MASHNSTLTPTTPDFNPNDTVRSNPYKKKISNEKQKFTKFFETSLDSLQLEKLKNMDLNLFKNCYETSMTTNRSLFDLVLGNLNGSKSNQTRQTQTTQTTQTTKDQTSNGFTFADLLDEDSNNSSSDKDSDTDPVADSNNSSSDKDNDDSNKLVLDLDMGNDQDSNILIHNGIRIVYPDYKTMLNATKETYHQRSDEIKQLDLAFDRDYKKGILFIGGSGIGKTLLSLYYATLRKIPCVFMSCHSGITKDELIGSYQLVNGNSAYVLGEIIQAIICANDSPNKRSILILDELNCMQNDTQKILNEMLRFKDGISIPELGLKFKLKPDCKVLVLATSNPLSYSGTNELNPELESRFEIIPVPDLTSDELKQMINNKYKIDSSLLDNLIRLKEMINEAHSEQSIEKNFDPREFEKLVNQYTQLTDNKYDHNTALRKSLVSCLYGKFTISEDPDQTKFVYEQIESIFGIQKNELNWFD